MSTITLPNIRVSSDLTVRLRLKDGGVAIDWTTLSNVKAHIYSDAQRALSGRCSVSVDGSDSTVLICQYAANKPQYLGINRIIVQCSYLGETKTYDKKAFTFVRRTWEVSGEQVTIDDPDVDVAIEVTDVSSSILQRAISAALAAAENANEAADNAGDATEAALAAKGAAENAATAAINAATLASIAIDNCEEATRQANTAASSAASAAGTAREAADEADTAKEEALEAAAAAAQASEVAGADHTRAENDHSTATSDHNQAGSDHTTAAADHTAAAADHTQAGQDHTRANDDHTQAAADHTQALEDHAVMQGYDTRLGNVEGGVSQLQQKTIEFSESGYILRSSGKVLSANDWAHTPFIIIDAFLSAGVWGNSIVAPLAFYSKKDDFNSFLGTLASTANVINEYAKDSLTIPDGAKYVVATTQLSRTASYCRVDRMRMAEIEAEAGANLSPIEQSGNVLYIGGKVFSPFAFPLYSYGNKSSYYNLMTFPIVGGQRYLLDIYTDTSFSYYNIKTTTKMDSSYAVDTIDNAGTLVVGHNFYLFTAAAGDDRPYLLINGAGVTGANIEIKFWRTDKFDDKEESTRLSNLGRIAGGWWGKKISVIGDSISTYDLTGYKIDGYSMHYPTNDVNNVNYTYWKMLADVMGAKIEVNASCGNSRSSNTNQQYPDFYARTSLLGSPDVIIVALGTNDSGGNVSIGSFNYDSEIADLSEATFADSYIKGIKALMANYPDARIVCVSLYMGDAYADAIKEIAAHYSLAYYDARGYTAYDTAHANRKGMVDIANSIYGKIQESAGGSAENAVLYVSQTLTDSQREQARKNIRASAEQYGVISQTQTWSGSNSDGYTYTMSGLVYGYIPKANIDLYEAAGAVFNSTTGYFELNGLTDISYQEMQAIYFNSFGKTRQTVYEFVFAGIKIRTNFSLLPSSLMAPPYGTIATNNIDLRGAVMYSPIEVFAYSEYESPSEGVVKYRKISNITWAFFAFNGKGYLKKVIGALNMESISSMSNLFSKASSLEYIKLMKVKASVSFEESPNLLLESVVYLVDNAANTSAITITLHAKAYARCSADITEYTYNGTTYTGVIAYAAAKNITITSA